MKLQVTKMHGCRNSFLVIDEVINRVKPQEKSSVVRDLSKKMKTDGVLFVSKGTESLEMRIFDRDGTEETMCGNGIRCAARYMLDRGYAAEGNFTIQTLDGPKTVTVDKDSVEVDMGLPRDFQKIDESMYFVFTGVPHLVVFKESLLKSVAYKEGRRLRYDEELCSRVGHPEGVNVNFVVIQSEKRMRVMTYEVGVEGITNACGTGSTAAAYVSAQVGKSSLPTEVELLGGVLQISAEGDNLIMTGPTTYMQNLKLAWQEESTFMYHLRNVRRNLKEGEQYVKNAFEVRPRVAAYRSMRL